MTVSIYTPTNYFTLVCDHDIILLSKFALNSVVQILRVVYIYMTSDGGPWSPGRVFYLEVMNLYFK